MKSDRLKPLGRCRRLREQRSASELGRQRRRFAEIELGYQRALAAFEDNRQARQRRERQIYRAMRQKPVPVDGLETLRWELAAMELEIERLAGVVEQSRAELEAAAADVERARETYLCDSQAVRKWNKVVERAADREMIETNRLAEIEQDDAAVDHVMRK